MPSNILNFKSDVRRIRHGVNITKRSEEKKSAHHRNSRPHLQKLYSDECSSESSEEHATSSNSEESDKVIDFAAATIDCVEGIKRARLEFALSLVEAAAVLGTSATTLEREEAKSTTSLDYNDVVRKYELHVASTDGKRKRQGNLIFGSLPLKVARYILDVSIEEMARRQGYSLGHWKKIETNFRSLSDEKIEEIQNEVKAEFENLCSR